MNSASENCYERISRQSELHQAMAQHYSLGESTLIKMNKKITYPHKRKNREHKLMLLDSK